MHIAYIPSGAHHPPSRPLAASSQLARAQSDRLGYCTPMPPYTTADTIQRCAERALAEGWIVKPYWRHRRAPESHIAQLLFMSVLRLGDGGLAARPPSRCAPYPVELCMS